MESGKKIKLFKLFQYLYTYICTFSIRMRDLVLYGGTFESPISIVNEQDGLSITIATESCQTYESDNGWSIGTMDTSVLVSPAP